MIKMQTNNLVTYYLHVNTEARDKYLIDEELYSITGRLIIANSPLARKVADTVNKVREAANDTENLITPGLINAAGLLHEIFHFVIRKYDEEENPGVLKRGVDTLYSLLGKEGAEKVFLKFTEQFPPLPVYKGEVTATDYLQGKTGEKENLEILFEEMILLDLENINPSIKKLAEFFDNTKLKEEAPYTEFIKGAEEFFLKEKPLSLENLSLIEALRKPILANPDDPNAQLEYIIEKWGKLLDEKFLARLIKGKDLIFEDSKIFGTHGTFGTPPVPSYQPLLTKEEIEEIRRQILAGKRPVSIDEVSMSYFFEAEQFTEDIDWMPNVVMLAKNAYVWMNQLSKKYQRDIYTLEQIPDEELDLLVKRNINALWLIGLWERSAASKKIKQFCGNPEAESSAYSLYDYDIAHKLGGEPAFLNLKYRCAIRGIRLSSDMVPNHTGIFSRWVLEHPDFYIQTEQPPYPSYSFTGPDLSDSPAVQIRIEDKYYTRKDAAVVFQLIENGSGRVRYIYHGNDGTNMPWNDTAQLNLLKEEVREYLISAIKHVAAKTPIIRFDAAMTLAKKHYQRLWFPQPGLGGAIPSRSDYALTQEAFESAMPNEFWRDVVDRMNAEMPNTLLLAEAFWLMEGYFVRTLGMHRVYNSAFMHMFMKEENQKFRELITNTLEFNPEILKRYVNFMSNPDEETAVNQFGKGDKYFGVCVMLATLPGLPMLAHGQIEGFTEKYGMEYSKAYYNEFEDGYLIARHEAEIFPIFRKRYLFSEVKHFDFYDFVEDDGRVNHNVFAFTNYARGEFALVVYNNSYEAAPGTIHVSTGKVISTCPGEADKDFRMNTLASALNMKSGLEYYYAFRDSKTGLEYLRSGADIAAEGLYFNIQGYQYHVFTEFKEMTDKTGDLRILHDNLRGKGVPSVAAALRELQLMPLHEAVNGLFGAEVLDELGRYCGFKEEGQGPARFGDYIRTKLSAVISELGALHDMRLSETVIIGEIEKDLSTLKLLNKQVSTAEQRKNKTYIRVKGFLIIYDPQKQNAYRDLILIYFVMKRILFSVEKVVSRKEASQLYENLLLAQPLWQNLIRLNYDYPLVKQEFDLLKILASEQRIFEDVPAAESSAVELLSHPEIKSFIGYNVYQDTAYFSKENFNTLLNWDFTLELILKAERLIDEYSPVHPEDIEKQQVFTGRRFILYLNKMIDKIEALTTAAEEAGFKYDEILARLTPVPVPPITEVAVEKPEEEIPVAAEEEVVAKTTKAIVKKNPAKKAAPVKKVKKVSQAKTADSKKKVKPSSDKKKGTTVKKSAAPKKKTAAKGKAVKKPTKKAVKSPVKKTSSAKSAVKTVKAKPKGKKKP
ncbi:MAG: alpha-amylase [Ignavibacteriaceae bacterium]|nr:alpha-amylase [Ignavibacteriaceae bacterium]